jgi:ABC-2 type transport system ATP-binding protein
MVRGDRDSKLPKSTATRRSVLKRLGAAATVSVGGLGIGSTSALAQSDDGVTKTDTEITSFDGTEIKLSLFEPPSEGQHPAVFTIQGGTARRGRREGRAEALANNGYIALTYDLRGVAPSGGEWNAGGENDIKDISALIDFLRDGNSDINPPVKTEGGGPVVGLEGGSAGGWRSIRAASRDDRIDAVQGVITPYDGGAAFSANNVLTWPWAIFFELAITLPWVTTPDDPDFDKLAKESLETKEPADELVDWLSERSPKNGIEDVDAPTQILNRWHDRIFPARQSFDLYRGLSNAEERRLIMFDFVAHDFEEAPDPTEKELRFFSRARSEWLAKHLKGEDPPGSSPVTGPPIDFYNAQMDSFDSYEELPNGTSSFALGEAGKGSATALKTTGKNEVSAEFDFPVDGKLDLAGVSHLSLSVTPTGGKPHLFAALKDVPPGGGEPVHLKDQIAATELTDSGPIEFDLNGVQRTVEKGHTLRLVLALNDDALTDLELNGPYARADDDGLYVDSEPPAGITIHHSRGRSSTLEVTTTEDSEASK